MIADWTALIWLLPLCAIISWWLGRQSVRDQGAGVTGRINPDYFKGLNYVLNEQPDKAIEIFVKMLEVDSHTVDTHLTLGNLFRRRGEVDRAIRIHQTLIARPSLTREERAIAMLELGIDYTRSGLFDRAENLFEELVQSGMHTVSAYTELLNIYQQEKDWEKAIVTARRLENASGSRMNPVIANYYCELAEEKLAEKQEKQARNNLAKALSIDPDCVRVSLIEGRILLEKEKYKQAIKVYKRVEKQDPEYISEIITPISQCYRKLGNMDDLTSYLKAIVSHHSDITTILKLAEQIAVKESESAAVQFLASELRMHPTVKGVDQLIHYALSLADGSTRDSLASIKELTEKLLRNRSAYKCLHCGFDAKVLHWQCPSCKQWNTTKPVHGL